MEGGPFFNDPAGEEVFLDNPVAAFEGEAAIPDAFGIDEEPGSVPTDAEAGGFAAQDGLAGTGELVLQEGPDFLALLGVAAIGPQTEEDMALPGFDGKSAQESLFFHWRGEPIRTGMVFTIERILQKWVVLPDWIRGGVFFGSKLYCKAACGIYVSRRGEPFSGWEWC